MDTLNEFDLNTALDKWVKYNCSGEDLTPADVQEMRDHFLNTVNELKEKNLNDEEAFAVAKIRIGGANDWSDEIRSMNEDNFQLKKVVLLFSGIFMFILSYNLITSVNKLLFLWLNYYNGDAIANIEISKIYMYFEGQMPGSEKAAFGRSKQKQTGSKLIGLALSIDSHGFVRHSRFYKGNISEPGTFEAMLSDVVPNMEIKEEKPVIVMDAG